MITRVLIRAGGVAAFILAIWGALIIILPTSLWWPVTIPTQVLLLIDLGYVFFLTRRKKKVYPSAVGARIAASRHRRD